MASNTNMKADDVISRGSIVDISRRWLLLAYLAGVNWCTHYILALMCRFYASKQFCCPGTCARRNRYPATGTGSRSEKSRVKRVPDGVQLYYIQ